MRAKAATIALGAALAIGLAPPAEAHPGAPYWTLRKLNATAISAIVRISGKNYLAIFLECRGDGRPVVRRGVRAWKHFRCVARASRGGDSPAYAVRFRLHVLRGKDRFITSDGAIVRRLS